MAKDDDKADDKTDDKDTPDPRDEAKSLIAEVVAEQLDIWTKKHKPAPRKTDPDNEGSLSVFETLFGKRA